MVQCKELVQALAKNSALQGGKIESHCRGVTLVPNKCSAPERVCQFLGVLRGPARPQLVRGGQQLDGQRRHHLRHQALRALGQPTEVVQVDEFDDDLVEHDPGGRGAVEADRVHERRRLRDPHLRQPRLQARTAVLRAHPTRREVARLGGSSIDFSWAKTRAKRANARATFLILL